MYSDGKLVSHYTLIERPDMSVLHPQVDMSTVNVT